MATPVTSGSIGTRRDLMVRLGDTLRPQVVTVRLKSGVLAPGGRLLASLYRQESDMSPLASPAFEVERLESPAADGAPRYRLSLSKEDVRLLATQAADAPTAPVTVTLPINRTRATRTVYWTCSYEDAALARYPIFFGRLVIYLGASSG